MTPIAASPMRTSTPRSRHRRGIVETLSALRRDNKQLRARLRMAKARGDQSA